MPPSKIIKRVIILEYVLCFIDDSNMKSNNNISDIVNQEEPLKEELKKLIFKNKKSIGN